MNKQHGIIATLILYGIAAAAIAGGIWYVYHYIDTHWETKAGYSRGATDKQAEWTEANRQAEAAAQAERNERARLASAQSAKLATAEGRARDAEAKWRAARAKAQREGKPLVVANCPEPAGSVPSEASGGGGLRLATSIRFTAQWLSEWDAAWLDQAGQPFWPDPGRTSEAAGTASSIDAEAVLGNHAENASRCSANARQMNALIDLLEQLRAR